MWIMAMECCVSWTKPLIMRNVGGCLEMTTLLILSALAIGKDAVVSANLPSTQISQLYCNDSQNIHILASKSIRAGRNYAVRIHSDYPESLTILVQILSCIKSDYTCTPHNGSAVQRTQDQLPAYGTAVVTLKVPYFRPDFDHLLYVTAKRNTSSDDTPAMKLTVEEDTFLTFIQFDKSIYKPGETVQYHLLLIDDHLLPINSTVNTVIKDPMGATVEKIFDRPPSYPAHPGFVKGDLILSRYALLGDWTVEVTVGQQTEIRKFEVAEYILPRFSGHLDGPKFVHAGQDSVILDASARRHYGDKLPFDCDFKLHITGPNGIAQIYTNPNTTGSAQFIVPIDEIIGDLCVQTSPIPIHGVVKASLLITDSTTGKTQTLDKTIPLYCDPFVLAVTSSLIFHPGLPHKFVVTVKGHDGQPLLDCPSCRDHLLQMTIQYSNHVKLPPSPAAVQRQSIRIEGEIDIALFPELSTQRIDVALSLGKVHQNLTLFSAVPSYTRSYMSLEAIGVISSQIAGTGRFKLFCTNVCPGVDYVIVSRGEIIQQGHRNLSRDLTETASKEELSYRILEFNITKAMAPQATLVVYYYRCGERVATSLNFAVNDSIQNQVKLTVKPETNETRPFARPGQEPREKVMVEIDTKPGSLVGTLALDTRLIQLGKIKSLTNHDLIRELLDREKGRLNKVSQSRTLGDLCDTFENAGLISYSLIVSKRPQPAAIFRDYSSYGNDISVDEFVQPGKEWLDVIPDGIWSDRRDFREMFFFQVFFPNDTGTVAVTKDVPDSLTTWKFFGFSLHNQSGLAFAEEEELQVYQELSVEFELPYNIIQNETTTLDFIVTHHLRPAENVTVTVKVDTLKSKHRSGNTIHHTMHVDNLQRDHFWKVPLTVAWPVIGKIVITAEVVVAEDKMGKKYRDKAAKELNVRSSGVKKDFTSHAYTITAGQHLVIPVNQSITNGSPNMIPDSLVLEFVIFGGSWAPLVKQLTDGNELQGLIELPGGCGEQNMARLLPNVFVMKYLAGLNLLTKEPARLKKLERNIQYGYLHQFKYQLADHSFSAWGNQQLEVAGSTWLTAFVVRGFAIARPYINDTRDLSPSYRFIESRQSANGSFLEYGFIIEREKAGEATQGVELTAFVVLALVEVGQTGLVTVKAESHLRTILPTIQRLPYTLAIVTYALAKLRSPEAQIQVRNLLLLAVKDNDRLYWTDSSPGERPTAKTIEGTAYAILALEELGFYMQSDQAVKWLLSLPRNPLGGFISTQDTVVALQALSQVASRKTMDHHYMLHITSNVFSHTKTLGPTTFLAHSPFEIPANTTSIQVQASGHGSAFLRLIYHYYEKPTVKAQDKFILTLDAYDQALLSDKLANLDITCRNKGTGYGIDNQIILHAEALSGYEFLDHKDDLLTMNGVEKVTYSEAQTEVDIFFRKLGHEAKTFQLHMCKTANSVYNRQSRQVKIYEFYEPNNVVVADYTL